MSHCLVPSRVPDSSLVPGGNFPCSVDKKHWQLPPPLTLLSISYLSISSLLQCSLSKLSFPRKPQHTSFVVLFLYGFLWKRRQCHFCKWSGKSRKPQVPGKSKERMTSAGHLPTFTPQKPSRRPPRSSQVPRQIQDHRSIQQKGLTGACAEQGCKDEEVGPPARSLADVSG